MALKRIITAEEKRRREKINGIIIGVILGIILLLSTAGYLIFDFNDSSDSGKGTIEYKGIKFQQTEYGTWQFNIYEKDFETFYNPLEISNITISTKRTLADYKGKIIYFSADPIEEISQAAASEIMKNLNNVVLRSNSACLENAENNCTGNYPVKNCSTSGLNSMIIFKSLNSLNSESNSSISTINDRENCVVINYAAGEEEKAADAFIFKILGLN